MCVLIWCSKVENSDNLLGLYDNGGTGRLRLSDRLSERDHEKKVKGPDSFSREETDLNNRLRRSKTDYHGTASSSTSRPLALS